MKKILFLASTYVDLSKNRSILEKKYSGYAKMFEIYTVGKGPFSYKKEFGCKFFLAPRMFLVGWMIWAFFVSSYLIKKNKITTVITQLPLWDGFLGVFLRKIFKIELIVQAQGNWVEAPLYYRRYPSKKLFRKLFEALGRFSLKRADKIRTVADCYIEMAKKYNGNRKIPYFVFATYTDLDIFLNEKDIKQEDYILFVGWLDEVKGVHFLLKAYALLNKEISELSTKLLIAGSGSQSDNLKKIAEKYGIKDKINFLGGLALSEVKNYMKNCLCLVLPSISEGLPRVILEAMALEKPVIASNIGGIPEVVFEGKNGFLCEVGDIQCLKKSMKRIILDKRFAALLGRNGKDIVREKFSTEMYFEAFEKMINS